MGEPCTTLGSGPAALLPGLLSLTPGQSEVSIKSIDQSEASIKSIDQLEASIESIDQWEVSIMIVLPGLPGPGPGHSVSGPGARNLRSELATDSVLPPPGTELCHTG